MVTFTNMKNIILIVEIDEIIYDMFYYFGKNLRFMYSTIIWNKSMVSLVIAIFTIHLLSYCDSIKMVGGNYPSPFKENIYTRHFLEKYLPSKSTHILIMPAIRVLLE